ncbi:MAG TPA: hypothetical protein VN889_08490 [Solirubrobacteraceae bacterium]|nr:hypothetical protein [Solirubrobacteraceae bacterium]
MNGSDVAFFAVVAGTVDFAGSSFFDSGAVDFSGVLDCFSGDVPDVGVGVELVVAGGVVGVVVVVVVGGAVYVVVPVLGVVYVLVEVVSAANTTAGETSAIIRAKATDSATSLRALGDPFLVIAVPAFCGLLEATTSVRVMPTSRDGLGECSSPLRASCPLIGRFYASLIDLSSPFTGICPASSAKVYQRRRSASAKRRDSLLSDASSRS